MFNSGESVVGVITTANPKRPVVAKCFGDDRG
jgi:hypothetical protein